MIFKHKEIMEEKVVITGIGMVTPLGYSSSDVLENISKDSRLLNKPDFDTTSFDCPYCATVADFDAENYFPESKTLRLMNRDAQMAVVAAHLAVQDASMIIGTTYKSDEVGLYGATGMAGMALADVTRLIQYSADPNGVLDLKRFGQITLKRVRPVLSFKLLSNMPICFVSIFEDIRGENAVYTPWEGQGAQAIISALHAVRSGRVPCALVGGCDVRSHIFSFINLQQLGVFTSWKHHGKGCIPGEGAIFVVLEKHSLAKERNAKIYAGITDYSISSRRCDSDLRDTYSGVLSSLKQYGHASSVIAAGDGDPQVDEAEKAAMNRSGFEPQSRIYPKSHVGNLFAAAAPLQVALAAIYSNRQENHAPVLANCFGFGSEQAAFVLDKV